MSPIQLPTPDEMRDAYKQGEEAVLARFEKLTAMIQVLEGRIQSLENQPAKSGDITVGDISNATTAIGHGASINQISNSFNQIYTHLASRPEDKNVDKREISEIVQNIEAVVEKNDRENVKIEHWLSKLEKMAPDIFEVTVNTLANPLTGLGTVIRKVAEKAKLESGASSRQ